MRHLKARERIALIFSESKKFPGEIRTKVMMRSRTGESVLFIITRAAAKPPSIHIEIKYSLSVWINRF